MSGLERSGSKSLRTAVLAALALFSSLSAAHTRPVPLDSESAIIQQERAPKRHKERLLEDKKLGDALNELVKKLEKQRNEFSKSRANSTRPLPAEDEEIKKSYHMARRLITEAEVIGRRLNDYDTTHLLIEDQPIHISFRDDALAFIDKLTELSKLTPKEVVDQALWEQYQRHLQEETRAALLPQAEQV